MENQSQGSINEELPRDSSGRINMVEYFKKRGIPSEDTTMQHLGKTSLMPSQLQKKEPDDSAETMMRNLSRRGKKPEQP